MTVKFRDRLFLKLYGIRGMNTLLPPRNIRTIYYTHMMSILYIFLLVVLAIIEFHINYTTLFFFLLSLMFLLVIFNSILFTRHYSVRFYRCPLYAIAAISSVICAVLSKNAVAIAVISAPLPVILISEKSVLRQIIWLAAVPIVWSSLLYIHLCGKYSVFNTDYNDIVIITVFYVLSATASVLYRFSIGRTFWGNLSKYRRTDIIDIQMELAQVIQRTLIPEKSKTGDKYQAAFYYHPAYGIGGDYFDIFEMSDGRVGVVMCDVAGKGIPAALMMASVRTLTRALVSQGINDPLEIIRILNDTFRLDFGDEFYVTLAFLCFDSKTGMIDFYNAGHTPFIYYSRVEKRIMEIELDGYPIGVFDQLYHTGKITEKMYSGDIVVLFSDGLTDFIDSGNHASARSRLFLEIQKNADLDAQTITDRIIDFFIKDKKSNIVDDDISLVIFKVK